MAGTAEFLIESSEALVFGPPRSSTAGEAHRIESQFPPSPRAFQGMLRARLLHGADPPLDLESGADNAEIERLVGSPDRFPAGWQLRGPFPALRLAVARGSLDAPKLQPWVPVPRFMLHAHGAALHAHEIRSTHPGLSDLDLDGTRVSLLGRPEFGALKSMSGWVGPRNLLAALSGEGALDWDAEQWWRERPPFVHREIRPGLAVDGGTATARHGMLYFAGALRFAAGSGLYGRLDARLDKRLDLSTLSHGAVQAGRKGRIAVLTPVEALDADWQKIMNGSHLPAAVEDGARFWLYALTPARPDATPDREDALGLARGGRLPAAVRVKLCAALTGRPQVIGGYRLADRTPRPNLLYHPAGSAWLIELSGGSAEQRRDALHALHDRHPLAPQADAAMGFGHTLVGIGPKIMEG
ncbi:MAG: hypothetical protein KF778_19820 [Rhodocyclaceae bacterium]|nr:hypothetical protein [Rhodocyclaceae bacterium]